MNLEQQKSKNQEQETRGNQESKNPNSRCQEIRISETRFFKKQEIESRTSRINKIYARTVKKFKKQENPSQESRNLINDLQETELSNKTQSFFFF